MEEETRREMLEDVMSLRDSQVMQLLRDRWARLSMKKEKEKSNLLNATDFQRSLLKQGEINGIRQAQEEINTFVKELNPSEEKPLY